MTQIADSPLRPLNRVRRTRGQPVPCGSARPCAALHLPDAGGVGSEAGAGDGEVGPAIGDRTHFRVRFDVATPFKFLDPQIELAARKRA